MGASLAYDNYSPLIYLIRHVNKQKCKAIKRLMSSEQYNEYILVETDEERKTFFMNL